MDKFESMLEKMIHMTENNKIDWTKGIDQSRVFYQFFTPTFRVKFMPRTESGGTAIIRQNNEASIEFFNRTGKKVVLITEDDTPESKKLFWNLQEKVEKHIEKQVDAELNDIESSK